MMKNFLSTNVHIPLHRIDKYAELRAENERIRAELRAEFEKLRELRAEFEKLRIEVNHKQEIMLQTYTIELAHMKDIMHYNTLKLTHGMVDLTREYGTSL